MEDEQAAEACVVMTARSQDQWIGCPAVAFTVKDLVGMFLDMHDCMI
jgi:hypothetical protein